MKKKLIAVIAVLVIVLLLEMAFLIYTKTVGGESDPTEEGATEGSGMTFATQNEDFVTPEITFPEGESSSDESQATNETAAAGETQGEDSNELPEIDFE